MKTCGKCSTTKTVSEFYKDGSKKDGLATVCKLCKNQANKSWQIQNPGSVNAVKEKYRVANRDKTRAAVSKWQKKNPEKVSDSNHKRRVRLLNSQSYQLSKSDMKRLYSSSCAYCGATEDITLDHVVPLKRGGSHGIGNLVAACRTCNSSKGAKLLVEWHKVY